MRPRDGISHILLDMGWDQRTKLARDDLLRLAEEYQPLATLSSAGSMTR